MNKFALFLLLVVFFFACKNEKKPQVIHVEQKKTSIPDFDGKSAYEKVKSQLDFGPREPNTPAHTATKEWIVKQAKATGCKVLTQDFEAKRFDGKLLKGTNIMVQYRPELSNRILLITHWDTRYMSDQETDPELKKLPVPGADDGASGTAVLLEMAQTLQKHKPKIGVDMLFVDLEDQGAANGDQESWCLGSQHWSRNKVPKGYKSKFGILLDMVGHKRALFKKEKFSERYAPRVNNLIWNSAKKSGNGQYFLNGEGRAVLDDHVFINLLAQIPTVDIIYTTSETTSGFGKHWHTQGDNINIISPDKLEAVGETLLMTIYKQI